MCQRARPLTVPAFSRRGGVEIADRRVGDLDVESLTFVADVETGTEPSMIADEEMRRALHVAGRPAPNRSVSRTRPRCERVVRYRTTVRSSVTRRRQRRRLVRRAHREREAHHLTGQVVNGVGGAVRPNAGIDVRGNVATSKPARSRARLCAPATLSISGATTSGSSGAPLSHSSGHARTRSTGDVSRPGAFAESAQPNVRERAHYVGEHLDVRHGRVSLPLPQTGTSGGTSPTAYTPRGRVRATDLQPHGKVFGGPNRSWLK